MRAGLVPAASAERTREVDKMRFSSAIFAKYAAGFNR